MPKKENNSKEKKKSRRKKRVEEKKELNKKIEEALSEKIESSDEEDFLDEAEDFDTHEDVETILEHMPMSFIPTMNQTLQFQDRGERIVSLEQDLPSAPREENQEDTIKYELGGAASGQLYEENKQIGIYELNKEPHSYEEFTKFESSGAIKRGFSPREVKMQEESSLEKEAQKKRKTFGDELIDRYEG